MIKVKVTHKSNTLAVSDIKLLQAESKISFSCLLSKMYSCVMCERKCVCLSVCSFWFYCFVLLAFIM